MSNGATLNLLRIVADNPTMNETARKEIFILHLPQIFPEPECKSRLESLTQGAESFLRTERSSQSSSSRGFADTLQGKLLFELKDDLTAPCAQAEADLEMRKYIASLWTEKGVESSYCCISTDVLRWCIWRPFPTQSLHSGPYNADMVKLELSERLDASTPSEENAHHLYLLLKRVLIDEYLLPLTAENLSRDFGLDSQQCGITLPALQQVIQDACQDPQVQLATQLWQTYQDYNARSSVVLDVQLYTKHVYLVLLSRLIVAAYHYRTRERLIGDAEIRGVLNGAFFHTELRLVNFVERDLFGWTTTSPWLEHLLPHARLLYHNLLTYDFSTASQENVLRLIYNSMMPVEQRDHLGQHSTPEQLVQPIVDKLLEENSTGQWLDPACGMGTFVQATLRAFRQQLESSGLSGYPLLVRLVDSVTGIDVDPVSVLLTKAVWALTLSDLLIQTPAPVHVPIYHADSLFLTTDQRLDASGHPIPPERPCLSFDGTTIEIPTALLNSTRAFDQIVSWCQCAAELPTLIPPQESLAEWLPTILGDSYSSELQSHCTEIAQVAFELTQALAERIQARRNGIWAFVVRNSHRPSLLAGKFDVIVCNPPWLAMSRFPDVPYKDQLTAQATYFRIKPGGSAFLHTEIATTFLLHTVSHFLAPGGKAAFVMPRSIFNGDHHHHFRTADYRQVMSLAITEIWDLEATKVFKIPSCVLFVSRAPEDATLPDAPAPAYFWSTLDGGLQQARAGSVTLSRLGDKTAWVDAETEASLVRSRDHYPFKEGADLMPRIVFFVETIHEHPSQQQVSIQTAASEINNKDVKVLQGVRFTGMVNRKYFFTTATSNHLLPFVVLADQLPTVVLPVEVRDVRFVIVSENDLIAQGELDTLKWFQTVDRRLREEIGSATKTIRDRINERGKLLKQTYFDARYLVHTGAGGTYPCAAVQRMDSTPHTFVADQTTYVYATDDEDEAFYLVGILNAPIVGRAIANFQPRGDRGPRHIHTRAARLIPAYDPANLAHQAVVKRARLMENQANAALSERMRDLRIPIASRRREMRQAIAADLQALDQVVKGVLSQ